MNWRKEYIYILTKSFPPDERFGLISQLRRASVSVPSNIAEGYYQRTKGEYAQFCHIALDSLKELETQIMLAKDLNMTSTEHFDDVEALLEETSKVLGSLCRSFNR